MEGKIIPSVYRIPADYFSNKKPKFSAGGNDKEGCFYRDGEKYVIKTGKNQFADHVFAGTSKYPNYTIDKTRILEVFEIDPDVPHYMIAPKRFGKTFTASMICSFYDYYYRESFEELFKGTYIKDNYAGGYSGFDWLCNCGEMFIFNMTLRGLLSGTFQIFVEELFKRLCNAFEEFSMKYAGVNLINQFKQILEKNCSTLESQILQFFRCFVWFFTDIFLLSNGQSFKLMVFIDEFQDSFVKYANCINDDLLDPRAFLISSFLCSLLKDFNNSEKHQKPILLMLGQLPFPHSLKLAGLEMIECHDITSPLTSHFIGFLTNEVEKMFQDFKISSYGKNLLSTNLGNFQFCSLEEMKAFAKDFTKPTTYDETTNRLYFPCLLMLSIKKAKIVSEHIGGVFLNQSLDKLLNEPDNLHIVSDLIAGFIRGYAYNQKMDLSNIYDMMNITTTDYLIKILFISGFFKYNNGKVWIPNNRIKEYFINIFMNHMFRMGIPISLPNSISEYLDNAEIYKFLSSIQENLLYYIQFSDFFDISLPKALLFVWLKATLKQCKVYCDFSFFHESNPSRGIYSRNADLVVFHPNGLAIVIEQRDSTDKNQKNLAKEGYELMFDHDLYDFSDFKEVKEVVICSLTIEKTSSRILFSGPNRKDIFGPESDPKNYPTLKINSNNCKVINDCKVRFINSNNINVFKVINTEKHNSSIIVVDNIKDINDIGKYSAWKIINGNSSQQIRDDIIFNFPSKNQYIIITIPVLIGLSSFPQPEVVFLIAPPDNNNEFERILRLCTKDLVIFYNESQKSQKNRIEEYLINNKSP